MASFRTTRRVEFADTDLEGIVHFARYLVYLETAEHELLRAAGFGVTEIHDGVRYTWPRVKVECEYLAPLAFGDRLEIEVTVAARGRSSVTYEHRLRKGDEAGDTPEPVARGRVTAVCCVRGEEGKLQPVPLPPALAERLDRYR